MNSQEIRTGFWNMTTNGLLKDLSIKIVFSTWSECNQINTLANYNYFYYVSIINKIMITAITYLSISMSILICTLSNALMFIQLLLASNRNI